MAQKHLQVKAELTEAKDYEGFLIVNLTLLWVSHVGAEFGSTDKNHRIMGYDSISFKHKGVCLYSTNSEFTFYGKQSSNHEADIWLSIGTGACVLSSTRTTTEYWPRLKAAIQAYNEWGATQ